MTGEELQEVIDNCPVVVEVAALRATHSDGVECVVMGPMGQTDVVALSEVLAFADERYDFNDFLDVHVCTLEDYIKEAQKQSGESMRHYVPLSSDSPVAMCGEFVEVCTDAWEKVTCPKCLEGKNK